MNKYELTKRIENFAPLETQEKWDCSGWIVDVPNNSEISKVMLCLTVTDDVIKQAQANNCDMIISHHPLFFVPFSYLSKGSLCHSEAENFRDPSLTLRMTTTEESHKILFTNNEAINIYSAHTNLDLAQGGTTDVLIENVIKAAKQLGSQAAKDSGKLKVESGKLFNSIPLAPCGRGQNCLVNGSELSNSGEGFLRYLSTNINIYDFISILKQISPNLRYVNNKNIQTLRKIAFCAGSGAEFIEEAHSNGADALVTGDLKFHTALDSPIVLFDIGHFESEIGVLKVFETLINNDIEVIYAQEKSPFNY